MAPVAPVAPVAPPTGPVDPAEKSPAPLSCTLFFGAKLESSLKLLFVISGLLAGGLRLTGLFVGSIGILFSRASLSSLVDFPSVSIPKLSDRL